MERLTEAYLANVMPLEEYRKRRQQLAERLTGLNNQAHLIETQVHQQMEVASLCTSMTEFCLRVARGLEQVTFEQKRQLVELLVDRVVVTMEEVEIRYVIPTSLRSEKIRFCHLHTDYFRIGV
jgi:site-specific DNA recombinase